jgi:hypothetical protein
VFKPELQAIDPFILGLTNTQHTAIHSYPLSGNGKPPYLFVPAPLNAMAFQIAKRDLRKRMRETLQKMPASLINQQC